MRDKNPICLEMHAFWLRQNLLSTDLNRKGKHIEFQFMGFTWKWGLGVGRVKQEMELK